MYDYIVNTHLYNTLISLEYSVEVQLDFISSVQSKISLQVIVKSVAYGI